MPRPEWWPGEDHEAFTEWAMERGVEALGVAPARFPGRGLGMIATRKIKVGTLNPRQPRHHMKTKADRHHPMKKGEAVVQVPTSVILTMDKIPSSFKNQFPEGTAVQTILAAYFTHGSDEELAEYDLWRKAWPTRQDFEDSLPILWPKVLGGLPWPDSEAGDQENGSTNQPNFLPPCISGTWNSIDKGSPFKKYESEHRNLLLGQELRLRKAWADVTAALPDTDWRSFSYHWLILNTRSFYWVGAGQEPPEDRNDAMAMLPFADYFNHSDVEVRLDFTSSPWGSSSEGGSTDFGTSVMSNSMKMGTPCERPKTIRRVMRFT